MPTRGNLWLRSSRGLAHVLVDEQGDQKHQADIAERIENALPAPANMADLSGAAVSVRIAHARPSTPPKALVRRSDCVQQAGVRHEHGRSASGMATCSYI